MAIILAVYSPAIIDNREAIKWNLKNCRGTKAERYYRFSNISQYFESIDIVL